MNRKQLLQMARDAGFKGAAKLKDLLAWIDENGVEFEDANGNEVDVESAWGTKARLVLDQGESLNSLEVEMAEGGEEKAEDDDEEEDEDFEKSARYRSTRRKENAQTISGVKGQYRGIHEGNKAPAIQSKRAKLVKRYTDTAKSGGKVYIPGEGRKRPVFEDGESAEYMGAFIRYHSLNGVDYDQKANDEAIIGKAHSTTNNSLGGALVPLEFSTELIELKEEYGAARRVFGTIPMSRDTLTYPRLGTDVVPTWQGEHSEETSQDRPDFDNVNLTAQKLMGLSKLSSELMNDAAISVADIWTRSWSRGVGLKEDQAAFLGDGTSTYGGITGVRSSLGSAGKVTLTGANFAAVTLAEVVEGIGKLPGYALESSPVWVMNSAVWYGVLSRLQAAAGGNTTEDLARGSRPMFQGFPVEFSQAMPATDPGATTVFAFLGAFPLAGKFGEVTGSNEVATSDQRYFEYDQIAIRGRERVAINVHDAGDSSNAGPVIGFQLAS